MNRKEEAREVARGLWEEGGFQHAATGDSTARTGSGTEAMKLYTRADFEAEFEPKNLKTTAVKMLAGVGCAAAFYAIEGWKVYLTPLIVVLLYYAVRVIHALISERRK